VPGWVESVLERWAERDGLRPWLTKRGVLIKATKSGLGMSQYMTGGQRASMLQTAGSERHAVSPPARHFRSSGASAETTGIGACRAPSTACRPSCPVSYGDHGRSAQIRRSRAASASQSLVLWTLRLA
jgi:hypothetical protein